MLLRYFRYQLQELPKTLIDRWSFWGNRYPFNEELIRRLSLDQLQSFHCVNLAHGIKAPGVYYQQHPEVRYLEAVKQAFANIAKYHGQPPGMYGGDEPMHGNDPTQGVELCSVVEMMFSLETMLAITGDLELADRLERIAFNALPPQTTEDFRHRQYFQSANPPRPLCCCPTAAPACASRNSP